MIDTVIIGAGISGLTVANALKDKVESLIILERYSSCGGRIQTNRSNGVQYEIGAGRIHKDHARVMELIKRFGLDVYPISSASNYNNEPNMFLSMFRPIQSFLKTLDPTILSNHTIAELLPSEFHKILSMFPYYAEMHTLRSDIALPLFDKDQTMGSTEYYGIKGGFDQLIIGLLESVNVRTRHRVEDIRRSEKGFEIIGSRGKKAEALPFLLECKRVIIATEYRSFKDFSILRESSFVKHLTDSPLIRIYAVYPIVEGKAWFHDIPKTVTDSPLRFIIPINYESGLIMVSYTDGLDTNKWRNKEGQELINAIQNELMRVFPGRKIPEPTYLKKHDWLAGCTYWMKGTYNMKDAINPSKNVYICGESVSKEQSWIESALKTAEDVIKIFVECKDEPKKSSQD